MLPASSEWMIIFGVALLLFGPSKLPQLGGAIGASIRNFKKGMKGLNGEDETETNPVLESKDSKENKNNEHRAEKV
jgi:sec-independent protein translocase protein TatA